MRYSISLATAALLGGESTNKSVLPSPPLPRVSRLVTPALRHHDELSQHGRPHEAREGGGAGPDGAKNAAEQAGKFLGGRCTIGKLQEQHHVYVCSGVRSLSLAIHPQPPLSELVAE